MNKTSTTLFLIVAIILLSLWRTGKLARLANVAVRS